MFQSTQPMTNHPMSTEIRQSIQNCNDCSAVCLDVMQYALEIETDRIDMNILLACAEMCQTTSNVLMLHSQLQTQLCALCVEACEACANHCEMVAYGDEQLMVCAEVCRRCAETCYYMVMMSMYYTADEAAMPVA